VIRLVLVDTFKLSAQLYLYAPVATGRSGRAQTTQPKMQRIPLQFLGANGFPCSAYAPVLKSLSTPANDTLKCSRGALCFDSRASNVFDAMEGQRDWRKMVQALVHDIEKRNVPVVGLGHSFGGAMMLCAAAGRPELFRQVIVVGNMLKIKYSMFPHQGSQIAPRLGRSSYVSHLEENCVGISTLACSVSL
jgi:hypothetical protein